MDFLHKAWIIFMYGRKEYERQVADAERIVMRRELEAAIQEALIAEDKDRQRRAFEEEQHEMFEDQQRKAFEERKRKREAYEEQERKEREEANRIFIEDAKWKLRQEKLREERRVKAKMQEPLRLQADSLGILYALDWDGLVLYEEQLKEDVELLATAKEAGIPYKFRKDGLIAGRSALEDRVANRFEKARKDAAAKAKKEEERIKLQRLKQENKDLRSKLADLENEINYNNITLL